MWPNIFSKDRAYIEFSKHFQFICSILLEFSLTSSLISKIYVTQPWFPVLLDYWGGQRWLFPSRRELLSTLCLCIVSVYVVCIYNLYMLSVYSILSVYNQVILHLKILLVAVDVNICPTLHFCAICAFPPVSCDIPLRFSPLKSIPKYFFSHIHKNVWGPPCCPSPLCPRMSRWREPRWQDTSRQEHPQGFTDFTLTTLSHMATVSLSHTYHWRYIVRRVYCRVIFQYCSLFFGLWWIQNLCVDCDK